MPLEVYRKTQAKPAAAEGIAPVDVSNLLGGLKFRTRKNRRDLRRMPAIRA
jgi:hypothetical protein